MKGIAVAFGTVCAEATAMCIEAQAANRHKAAQTTIFFNRMDAPKEKSRRMAGLIYEIGLVLLICADLATKDDRPYSQIRKVLGNFIGKRVIDITQQDEDEFKENGKPYIAFHFENGGTVKIEDKSMEICDPDRTEPLDLDDEDDEGGWPAITPEPTRHRR